MEKTPQKYKEYTKAFNDLKDEILKDIKSKITNISHKGAVYNSIAFNEPFLSTCVLDVVDEDKDIIAWGITLDKDNQLIVHAGMYEPDIKYDIRFLNMGRVIRLYKVLEEALYEYPYEPFME